MAKQLTALLVPLLLMSGVVAAATLPPHPPLRILIVSDEVNPHGLSDEELTQPGDLSAAFLAPGAGLHLDPLVGVRELATDDIAQATALLELPREDPSAVDVFVYFAHRIPGGPDGASHQEAFVVALEAFLERGGGVVSFHHGVYQTAGKESVQAVLGGVATGGVTWDETEGQNVLAVAPGHFVSTWEVEYPGTLPYDDAGLGIPAGDYDAFSNVPDERYPTFVLHPEAASIEVLFASDYDQNGSRHLLGFTHRRPTWRGVVFVYQPGEHQPTALDDLDGNNFQILANGIVWVASPVFSDGFESGDVSRWE